MVKRELVGRVWVDHGRVAVVDPVYAALSETDEHAVVDGGDAVHLDLGDVNADAQDGVDHLGVAVVSGFGDGYYPVYIERAEFDGQTFVSRVVIDFLVTDEGAREFDAILSSAAVDDDVRRRALGEDG